MLTSFNQDVSGTDVFVTRNESPCVFYVRPHKWYNKMNNSFLFLTNSYPNLIITFFHEEKFLYNKVVG